MTGVDNYLDDFHESVLKGNRGQTMVFSFFIDQPD
jgi:hypothetical protein